MMWSHVLGAAHSLGSALLPDALQREIRAHLWRQRRAAFRPRLVLARYGPKQYKLRLVDQRGARWYGKDRDYEPELLWLMGSRLKRGAFVLEIGAHQGVVALALSDAVGPGGRVLAVEASTFDIKAARDNCALNGASNVAFLCAAIAARDGFVDFDLDGHIRGSRRHPARRTRAVCIDSLAGLHGLPDVIFIDVDGSEGEALAGAQGVLDQGPEWYVEVGPEGSGGRRDSVERVLWEFTRRGYEVLVAQDLRPSRRTFRPLASSRLDPSREFHLIASHSLKRAAVQESPSV